MSLGYRSPGRDVAPSSDAEYAAPDGASNASMQEMLRNNIGLPGGDPFDEAWKKIKPGTKGDMPFGWGSVQKNKYGGLEWGGGFSKRTDDGSAGATGARYEGHVGEWDDGTSGGHRYGWQMNGNAHNYDVGSADLGDGRTSGKVTAAGMSGSVDCWAGDDGFGLGAQANLGEAAIELKQKDAKRTDDEYVKIGVSEGEGIGVRGHWGDEDHDGHREYGFGFDVGPLSVDMTTEDPLKTLIKAAVPGSQMGLDWLTNDGKQNLTEMAEDAVTDAAKSAYDTVVEGVDEARKMIEDSGIDPSVLINSVDAGANDDTKEAVADTVDAAANGEAGLADPVEAVEAVQDAIQSGQATAAEATSQVQAAAGQDDAS